jgi:uncharacterized protein (TIGR02145 family)
MKVKFWSIKHGLLLFLLLSFNFNLSAQVISNVTAEQSGNSIIISYSLESDAACEITLNVSTDGGMTWIIPVKGISGDIGGAISEGYHSIRWAALEENKHLVSSSVKFKVIALKMEAFRVVKIGTQVWMSENLNIDHFRNGDSIPEARTAAEWRWAAKQKKPAWCYYDNNPTNAKTFGKFYNWYAVNDQRGLSPSGYHIPSVSEWMMLKNTLGSEAGTKMKSASGWKDNGNGTNSSGFNAQPIGTRDYQGYFDYYSSYCSFWSSSESSEGTAWEYGMAYWNDAVLRYDHSKCVGMSVRCVKD